MSLIDKTYFVGDLDIPNTNQATISGRLDWFIKKYEADFLAKVLGDQLAADFTAGYTQVTPAAKWVELAKGTTYTVNGVSVKWKGLIVEDLKQSPIANYVYYWQSRNAATKTTSNGEGVNKTENMDVVSAEWKQVKAWNEIGPWVSQLLDFLEAKKEVYTFTISKYKVLCQFGSTNPFGI